MDYIISELMGGWTSPMDLTVKFLILILVFDGIFGLVGTLFKPLLGSRSI